MCAMFSVVICADMDFGCVEKMLATFLQLYMCQDLSRHSQEVDEEQLQTTTAS